MLKCGGIQSKVDGTTLAARRCILRTASCAESTTSVKQRVPQNHDDKVNNERDAYLLLTGCADLDEYNRGFSDGQATQEET